MAPPRKEAVKRYRFVTRDGQSELAHRARAEAALGRTLPVAAQVHHVDGTTSDQSPLVICEDQAYHSLLHVRTRIVRAGGNPNQQRICSACRRLTMIEDMGKRKPNRNGSTAASQCKECIRGRANLWYANKTAGRVG